MRVKSGADVSGVEGGMIKGTAFGAVVRSTFCIIATITSADLWHF